MSPTPGSIPPAGIRRTGRVGLVGYEINFNRYFYQYRPPRPLEEIEIDIQQVEKAYPGHAKGSGRMMPLIVGI